MKNNNYYYGINFVPIAYKDSEIKDKQWKS